MALKYYNYELKLEKGITLKKNIISLKFIISLIIIFSVCFSVPLTCIARPTTEDININQSSYFPHKIQENNDDYHFFALAIIWGEFEILRYKNPFFGFSVENPFPYNLTMSVIGYVDYEHKWVFMKSYFIVSPHWIGFVGQHHLCVFAWGYEGVTVG
jgi:hypothetical protein